MRLLCWNIESFTNYARPNHRGRGEDRVKILVDTLRTHQVDVAVLLETGTDAPTLVTDVERISKREYFGAASPPTGVSHGGDDGRPTYDPETYVVLFRRRPDSGRENKRKRTREEAFRERNERVLSTRAQWSAEAYLESQRTAVLASPSERSSPPVPVGQLGGWTASLPDAVPTLSIVGDQGDGYRGAVAFSLGSLQIVGLHAPSPSHPLDVRIGQITRCVRDARSRGGTIVLVGDLNVGEADFPTLAAALAGEGFAHAGPFHNGAPERTSLRTNKNALLAEAESGPGDPMKARSAPYDQVWVRPEQARIGIASIVVFPTFANPTTDTVKEYAKATLERVLRSVPGASSTRRKSSQEDIDGFKAELAEWRVALQPLQEVDETRGLTEAVVAQVANVSVRLGELHDMDLTGRTQLNVSQSHADELLMATQLYLLGVDSHATRAQSSRLIATRTLMSDHLPILVTISSD